LSEAGRRHSAWGCLAFRPQAPPSRHDWRRFRLLIDGDASDRCEWRYYGRFERSLTLPFEVDEERAEASFKNGVLTVTVPKSATAKDTAKRIAINAESDTKH